jgi:hypothetical protein
MAEVKCGWCPNEPRCVKNGETYTCPNCLKQFPALEEPKKKEIKKGN